MNSKKLSSLATSAAGEPVAPTVEAAQAMGEKGAPATEVERLAFEAWMRGHCWALSSAWNGTEYRSPLEVGGNLDPRAMATRRLWAAWRDRAALAALAPTQPAEPHIAALRSIAASTCCDRCQEAALVARKALDAAPPAPERAERVALTGTLQNLEAQQKVLTWNRAQAVPPIVIGREYSVVDQVAATLREAAAPLTEKQISKLWMEAILVHGEGRDATVFARAIERAHGIGGNTEG